jgi:hypothetical protein
MAVVVFARSSEVKRRRLRGRSPLRGRAWRGLQPRRSLIPFKNLGDVFRKGVHDHRQLPPA